MISPSSCRSPPSPDVGDHRRPQCFRYSSPSCWWSRARAAAGGGPAVPVGRAVERGAVPLAALAIVLRALPIAVAVVAGDAVAGEAQAGTPALPARAAGRAHPVAGREARRGAGVRAGHRARGRRCRLRRRGDSVPGPAGRRQRLRHVLTAQELGVRTLLRHRLRRRLDARGGGVRVVLLHVHRLAAPAPRWVRSRCW